MKKLIFDSTAGLTEDAKKSFFKQPAHVKKYLETGFPLEWDGKNGWSPYVEYRTAPYKRPVIEGKA